MGIQIRTYIRAIEEWNKPQIDPIYISNNRLQILSFHHPQGKLLMRSLKSYRTGVDLGDSREREREKERLQSRLLRTKKIE